MTVAQLIELLKELPPDHPVMVRTRASADFGRTPDPQQHTNHGGPWVSL